MLNNNVFSEQYFKAKNSKKISPFAHRDIDPYSSDINCTPVKANDDLTIALALEQGMAVAVRPNGEDVNE